MKAGSAPGAPLVPTTQRTLDFPTQREVFNLDSNWLKNSGVTSPDGSPLKIVEFKVDPPTLATTRQEIGAMTGSVQWGIRFAAPGVKAQGTVTIVVENSAGRNTITIPVRTGSGW